MRRKRSTNVTDALPEAGSAAILDVLDYPNGELVVGLVAAVGTDLEFFERLLGDHLEKFGFDCNVIRLSQFLRAIDPGSLGIEVRERPEGERLNSYMDAGDKLRHLTGRDDILALYAVSAINQSRPLQNPAFPHRAHILRSLKHPDEVHALRRIYGDGFYLIGVYSSEEDRLRFLTHDKNIHEVVARQLVRRDQEEAVSFGQQTRDAFQLADVFINLQKSPKEDLWRFLDLLFGSPYISPTPDENAMFIAYSSSLRSASLSRQVGAVVTAERGELIAVGANDVPSCGGGLYWTGPDDERDHVWGFDSNDRQRNEIILDVMKRLRHWGPTAALSDEDLLREGKKLLAGSPLNDLTEYGRAVHAEMEALLSCARSGVSPRGGTLYSTTFPCHNCAKHIVAAGLKRVVYVEPYPKSKAENLHSDSITVEKRDQDKVLFEPFVGVAARRYFDLFSMNLGSGYRLNRKMEGKAVNWDRATARLRVAMPPTSYIDRERLATSLIAQTVTKAGENLS
jgi:deoxycytidylate deaminase